MMEDVRASKRFEGEVQFTGQKAKNVGKLMSNEATCQLLGWQPKYTGFTNFIRDGGEDFYSTSGLYS